ncbi:DUF3656 domain-containing U32 family peptidase [Methanocalculus taiwanensis]|nr:U32 family peptidase [Methanocalculus taiwanensis]
MERRTHIPELLAPAGSREAFEAAVAAGADAVYLSGSRFGARAYAANFDDETLKQAIQDAHARSIRVYVTVNTLVSDDELPAVAEYLLFLYKIGADAVLIQDHGVLSIARQIVPKLNLHASTQMTIHSIEGLRYAKAHGISRVVLARELSIDEVRSLQHEAEALDIGLELFAHGALCMGYSGQCLLSSVIGGRSGNRGTCAQPCRRKYMPIIGSVDRFERIIPDREERDWAYLLSPQDLATYPRLPEMMDFAALKIEGRMKSPEYVATVTSIYRKALDQIQSGIFSPDPVELLSAQFAFNRGFTEGHLFGAIGSGFVSLDRPDNRGVRFGAVQWYDRERGEAVIGDLIAPYPERGDGIVFSKEGEEDIGCEIRTNLRIESGRMRVRVPVPVKRGMEVAINRRASVEQAAAAIIAGFGRGSGRKVRISLFIGMDEGYLSVSGHLRGMKGEDLIVTARSASPMAEARTRPLTAETISNLLTRTGETHFEAVIEELHYDGGLFLPIQEITALRRELLSEAENALIQSAEPAPGEVEESRKQLGLFRQERRTPAVRRSDPPVIATYADSIDQVRGALAGGCKRIYFEPRAALASCGRREKLEIPEWQAAILDELSVVKELCHHHDAACYWKFPDITRREFLDAALPLLGDLYAAGINGVMVGGVGISEAVRARVPEMAIAGSSALNITNHSALEALKPSHNSVALSREISLAELQSLCIGDDEVVEFFVQGSVPAMITEHCIAYGRYPCPSGTGSHLAAIMDQTGRSFPIRVDGGCRTIIGNAVETCLIDHLDLILDAGIAILGIELRSRTEEYAAAICQAYISALSGGTIDQLKDDIRLISWGGITTGPFPGGGFR